jgi:hypothetical protein
VDVPCLLLDLFFCLEYDYARITTGTGKNQITLPSRGALARKVGGMGRDWVQPGSDPIAELVEARSQEDDEEGDATKQRLPTIDGLIAATAAVNDMTLVHRDPHLAAIPPQLLQQHQLAEKQL